MSTNTQQKKVALLTLALDFGGSATKIVYATSLDHKARLLCMEPEVAVLARESILEYEGGKLGSSDPENVAWVAVGEQYRAVGYLAQSRFYANAGLSELKYERAIYKTLAAIWVIKEKLKLGSRLGVAIAVLLPPGEYEDRERFEKMLRSSLAGYQTPTGRMSVSLKAFNCKPEGGGIYLVHRRKVGEVLKTRVCAIAMIGYRNASVLVSHRGVIGEGKTSDLGFIRMLEKVMSKTSGLSPKRLTPAIVEAGDEVRPAALLRLPRSTTRELRAADVQQIVTAIKSARPEYAKILISWLDENLPLDVEEIVFCGGTADYLRKELNEHYDKVPLSWNADLVIPKALDTFDLGNRLADVYGMFLYFSNLVNTLPDRDEEGAL
ncbi:ParM/StbA family protein [Iningainema tapete]|uniref:ParM/StbA family protein n=1 Tax=Iningainema tapete BLCC-T55 TaxID=2748662 RepID=A0A8J6XHW8_9CYAN|nr:ParM/StbA family protein [Iningainema tapete]MBD2772586.1 ParM/StbA family protein [Iningainema tapete BLCC-T55]